MGSHVENEWYNDHDNSAAIPPVEATKDRYK